MEMPTTTPAMAAAPPPSAAPPPPPPAPTKGRGKRLTDRQRMDIIARLEDKVAPLSRAECARRYGVSPAAIGKLMKVRAAVKKRYADAGADAGALRDRRQRGGFAKNAGFEDELFQWICSIRARRIPLLVAHVQQKAKLLSAKHHGHDDFKASNGWYYRFCARYGLVPGALHSAAGAAVSGGGTVGPPRPPGMLADSALDDGAGEQAGPLDTRVRTKRANATTEESDDDDDEEDDEADEEEDGGDAPDGRRRGAGVKVERATDWRHDPALAEKVNHLQDTVKQFGPEFVYSVSEARVFYRLLPNLLLPAFSSDGADGDSPQAPGAAKGDTERVMVLVCANGTGTHKLPLLVVGKPSRPSCFLAAAASDGSRQPAAMQVGDTTYVSQREVWCDNQTFQYWCAHVFAPAVQARTTHPVLLLLDNPAGSLEAFHRANVSTYFLPTRPSSLGASLQHHDGAASNKFAQFQPLQHGVVRELKRRYKVALFHEVLSFLERGDEERYRLLQRALKRPHGAAGLAFGRLPHVGDAMGLLEEAWAAISAASLRDGWVRSELFADSAPGLRSAGDDRVVAISDDTIMLELSAMLRQIKSLDELQGLPKDMQLWLTADDDSSERMQQELLHDVQRLLQEEEDRSISVRLQQQQQHQQQQLAVVATVAIVDPSAPQQQQQLIEPFQHPDGAYSGFMHSVLQLHQQQQLQQLHSHPAYVAELSSAAASLGYGYPQHPHRKAASFALRALANAEEALDASDVRAHFGDTAAREAVAAVRTLLRLLRRVHRGKHSALASRVPTAAAGAAATAATTSQPPSSGPPSAQDVAASTHAFFYAPH